jgi:hypothetical protein
MTHKEAKALLAEAERVNYGKTIFPGGRNGNVWIERRDGAIAARLYQTDVVTFTPRYIELNTGGWPTRTTCQAISDVSPVQVYSERGALQIRLEGEDWNDGGHPFYDGIRVSPDGRRLMRAQPNRRLERVELESGFTRQPIAGRAGRW